MHEDPFANPPEGYGPPRMSDTVGHYWVCQRCGSSVGNAGIALHDQWHERLGA